MADTKKEWDAYVAAERTRVTPVLRRVGIVLDDAQPQTIGERYLTRPVGSGRKVVWFGRRAADNLRVVVKTADPSREPCGIEELAHEESVYAMLKKIHFAYGAFALPEILEFNKENGMLITEYIEQEKPFLERPLEEQFAIALNAFKAQEGAHAVTTGHWKELGRLMKEYAHYVKPGEYRKISQYAQDIIGLVPQDSSVWSKLDSLTDSVIAMIDMNEKLLERYDGFLTHWDFMPQNFRIHDGKLYLLDLTSMRFGNKYEGWARFINFMELYNPPLARALVEYVRLNRPEEVAVLQIMRAYRLIELIRYYSTWLSKTVGDTRELAGVRIAFWTEVLSHVLDDTDVPTPAVEAYKTKRDALRSEDEKIRQKGLH